MAKCLVLGANGFIGSHLVDSLIEKGHSIRAFDRFGDSRRRFNDHDHIEVVDGNFLNRDDLKNALNGVEYVFHFISTTTPITAENDPVTDITTNISMSVELLQECVAANVQRVIFASTGGAIYGEYTDGRLLSEDTMPLPISPYAIGKLTIENYLRYFRVKHGLDSITVRISNPYGERQPVGRKQGVIPIFLERIYDDQPVTVLGDGSMVRDYVYVKDVANIIAQIFDKDHRQGVYNLGSGKGESINELVDAMQQLTGKTVMRETLPVPSTFVKRVVLDTTALQRDFSVAAQTRLADGLKKTWQYICAHNEAEKK
ncbi:MAG TPA: NAD-dependent epimerase/dehydratase family protein [Candidatus Saccharimonadia bacterium]|nr:NAD-dependent epimerase/dehydratase family protein [Candidatus Saccharimonadia bacterium]